MTTRRDLLRRAPLFPASLLLAAAGQKQPKEEVPPGEDLMREHGVLNIMGIGDLSQFTPR